MNFDELKCRAKEHPTGKWAEGFFRKVSESSGLIYTGDWRECVQVALETVCRVTPFKAIDKILIHEGDLVELRRMTPSIPGGWALPPVSGEVKLQEGCWCVDTGTELITLFQEIDQWEIAGNIHDDPVKETA